MDRNPYVILGIPFGASRAQANLAFATRAKSLRRRGREGIDQLTDLTWALQQIDDVIRDPAAAMGCYRIPADPEVFTGAGAGVLRPPPERLAARPGDRDAALEQLRQAAAGQYLRQLVSIRAAGLTPPPW